MDFEVVIIGSDINAYYMARCTYEAYGKKAFLLAKEPMNFTKYSSILNIEYVGDLWQTEMFINVLMQFKNRHKDKKLLLVPSNDFYVRLINENQEILKPYYYFHGIELELLNKLLVKDLFYEAFNDCNIDLPKTYVYKANSTFSIEAINGFMFPLVLKPGDGVSYYKHHFDGQAKVYKFNDIKELLKTIKLIEGAGYQEQLIIQEFIPGDDSCLFDSIFYINQRGKAELATFAQIGLQEHTATGVGNLTVLVNGYNEYGEYDQEVEKLRKFIEETGYTGFCEFDLKYDVRDNKYKVFEINPRQARSSYYLAALGHNLIEYLVNDLILEQSREFTLLKGEMVLSFVPKKVIDTKITNIKLKNKINELIKAGKYTDPLDCPKDKHLLRKLWLRVRKRNYIKKYQNNEW